MTDRSYRQDQLAARLLVIDTVPETTIDDAARTFNTTRAAIRRDLEQLRKRFIDGDPLAGLGRLIQEFENLYRLCVAENELATALGSLRAMMRAYELMHRLNPPEDNTLFAAAVESTMRDALREAALAALAEADQGTLFE